MYQDYLNCPWPLSVQLQDGKMDEMPCGDMGDSKQQAENRRTAGWMRCPFGWMTGRIQGRLPTSFIIYNKLV